MTDKITIDRALLQQALEALDTVSLELGIDWLRPEFADAGSTATALRAALAAPQRQPRPFRECEDSQAGQAQVLQPAQPA